MSAVTIDTVNLVIPKSGDIAIAPVTLYPIFVVLIVMNKNFQRPFLSKSIEKKSPIPNPLKTSS